MLGAQTLKPTEAQIRTMARGRGFALAGVAEATPVDHGDYLRKWLAAGRHGEMGYLAEHLEKRIDARKLLPGARSVICVADRHASMDPADHDDPAPTPAAGQPLGRIARYAWGDDYHKVIKKRLHELADALRDRWPNETYRAAVDTAPILERDHATRARLGWIGKHTLLIHPRVGSWLLLSEIVTTLEIEPDAAGPITDHCGTCTRCIDACPTDCIRPYQLDASRCISYLTIEHRGPIDPSLHEPMGDWIAGCDICQQVCPFNGEGQGRRAGGRGPGNEDGAAAGGAVHDEYAVRPPGPRVSLMQVLNWDAAARREALTRSALKRIKLDQFKRNALIAVGNYLADRSDAALLKRIKDLAADDGESQLVRQTAEQVLERLSQP